MLNKGAIERGMFRSIYYKSTYDYEVYKSQQEGEQFEKPNPLTTENRNQNLYHKIDDSGFPEIGVSLHANDVLIGKTCPFKATQEQQFTNTIVEQSKYTRRDCSLTVKASQEGKVDAVLRSESQIGKQLVKVKIRQVREPEEGDKFASSNGQKGTCGLIVPQEDMPYTLSGMTPDLIMNVHAVSLSFIFNICILYFIFILFFNIDSK